MKALRNGFKWMTAALLVAATAVPAVAEKTTPATDKNTAVPAVPRAIPDLINYTKFDPPKSQLFDISKLTISGDMRVRPEFRDNIRFQKNNNAAFVQQWTRLGFNYAISPDLVFFFQPQYSKNWGSGGAAPGGPTRNLDALSTEGRLFTRQAFMLMRNFLVPNLTVKVGRQLVVWGNHRMFGHFDWNNVGWSHDGVTTNLKLGKTMSLQLGWLRTAEDNCGSPISGGCGGDTSSNVTDDADVIYVRAPMKVAGFVLEPTYIWHNNGTGGVTGAPRPPDQSRHTVGGRAVKKMPLGSARLDATVEGYYQFGDIEKSQGADSMDIEAYAFHVDAGVTLPVPMQPRLSAEFNSASGNKVGEKHWGSFDQLYPTNHIHFGYMDRMSWKNMEHLAFGLQLRPTKDSHFETTGHFFSRKETSDHWYGASQAAFFMSDQLKAGEDDLGSEVDVVYTHFFTQGNHVGWQIGAGVFFPGDAIQGDATDQTWGYTQLWVNF